MFYYPNKQFTFVGFLSFLLMNISIVLIASCSDKTENDSPQIPPTVTVITAQSEQVLVKSEHSGRLEPWRIAEVRAQVSGIIESRLFTEGSDVKAGDKLFQINAKPYQVAVQQAQSAIAIAEANLFKAKAQYDRFATLGKIKAVSELDEITTRATYKQAEAEVKAAMATLAGAQINLDYATVIAPISGRIGRSQVTEGALVGEGEATHLATIQQVNPIYASFSQSTIDALKLRTSYMNQTLALNAQDDSVPVQLMLEDGRRYVYEGRLLFGELTVDPGTAQINFRAEMPNPDYMLLPGMYARIIVEQSRYPSAFLIPQKAVGRDEKGDTVTIIDQNNRITTRKITIESSQGNNWIITAGIEDGDRIMVEGFFKVSPGIKVNPVFIDSSDTKNKPTDIELIEES